MKKKVLNPPNILSLLRVAFVPIFVAALLLMKGIPVWGRVVPTIIYILTGLTDMLDGQIARRYNMVTNFGKFIDALADKFMVIGSQIAIVALLFLEGEAVFGIVLLCVALLILFRELAVTGIRLVVAGNGGGVVAASMFGKIKTVSQMVGTVVILLDTLVLPFDTYHITAYVFMGIMAISTVASGLDYFKTYLPYLSEENAENA